VENEQAARHVTPNEPWLHSAIMIGTSIGFLALAFAVAYREWNPFWIFVPLPGCIGIANYIVTSRHREAEEHDSRKRRVSDAEERHRPTVGEAVAVALLMTAVFCVVASAADSKVPGMEGLTYAGYGAYISTLWLMLVRLNASALTPRFLMNSALKASIAMLIGYVASQNRIFTASVAMPSVCFFVGLFHTLALAALKRAAMATFGVTQPAGPADLSVRLLEGVDDGAADVLEELGITSVQHLATMHTAEVCGRSLYPRNRVLDWIDQSILMVHTNGRIGDLRAIGIRSAYALITVVEHATLECDAKAAANVRTREAEQRLGLATGGLQLLAQCIRTDPAYKSLESDYGRERASPPAKTGSADVPGLHDEESRRQAESPALQ
jgi:hypothetical protein